jgi:hypothetical protein
MYFWNRANGKVLEIKLKAQGQSVKPGTAVIVGSKWVSQNNHQQWRLTDDGYIESCLEGSLVLTIKVSYL